MTAHRTARPPSPMSIIETASSNDASRRGGSRARRSMRRPPTSTSIAACPIPHAAAYATRARRPLLADHRRDRDYVVGLEGVPKALQEAEEEPKNNAHRAALRPRGRGQIGTRSTSTLARVEIARRRRKRGFVTMARVRSAPGHERQSAKRTSQAVNLGKVSLLAGVQRSRCALCSPSQTSRQ